jgi:hypothetical protein
VDESLDRLHRAGWSIGDTAFGSKLLAWQVSGSNGENLLVAYGFSRAEAYGRACVQARALGMLAPPREEGA